MPHQREDVSALDRFNVHRCPTRRVFSGTRLELVTRQATIRYLYHLATAATGLFTDNFTDFYGLIDFLLTSLFETKRSDGPRNFEPRSRDEDDT
ncbi:uncharacterized protein TNCV_867221 [Trichonephila clavipes]|nr:uncharacterized protein TNCV_867221 [Trichonephila clavipes]